MKKSFMKIGFYVALAVTTIMFNACDPENGPDNPENPNENGSTITEIIATNVNGSSSEIATIKATIEFEDSNGNYQEERIAETSYTNNGFTLELPSTIPAKYLTLVDDVTSPNVNVSNRDAKLASIGDMYGYDKNGVEIGYFCLRALINNHYYCYTEWMYTDRDVTIKGEQSTENPNVEKYTFDLILKKGWNIAYSTLIETENSLLIESITTQKPSGINYIWEFVQR